ncbi:2-isopropylmalate synthase [Streptomyces sp. NBC_00258]|uniref:2-isopropylmalate synthase n=1 Tax=Streptomyces sp. NBC_00258 TaxID=2903642 RepID=UPI002E281FF5|nr:2-isopropylmalate synthase [Streptomyces sp. NBC_00258]
MPKYGPITQQPRQRPSGMPAWKYQPYPTVSLEDRTWPSRTISQPPLWCAVDLRDGNQALPIPMDIQRKRKLFDRQVRMGYKEIEVGFPAASQTDYEFVRLLIADDLIPDDVVIQVITPAREELIRRTFEAVSGARYAIVHLYNSTSCLQRDVVFDMNRGQIADLAVRATGLCSALAEDLAGTHIQFEYTPESFTGTELDFALEICDAVTQVWQPSPAHKMIVNLPATVEMSTPNVYADQIEWMHRNLARRDSLILSIHPHNDRGTAVAAAELAFMAGAERIEGCLFGNGERTGNVDLVTLGMNLFSQGIDPLIDFSDLSEIAATIEYCTGLPVHPRHPYAGELVYSAFSGSHQDAIKKGLEARGRRAAAAGDDTSQFPWAVPYLPIDPKDVGRDYEAVIRVNSQSGKGGVAYILKSEYQLDLPRGLQSEFAQLVQEITDSDGGEISPEEIWKCFRRAYLDVCTPIELDEHQLSSSNGREEAHRLALRAVIHGRPIELQGEGTGPIDALLDALGRAGLTGFAVRAFAQHALGSGSRAQVGAYVEISHADRSTWGAALHTNLAAASQRAVVSAVNRLLLDE